VATTRKRVIPYEGPRSSIKTDIQTIPGQPTRYAVSRNGPLSAFTNLDGSQVTVSESHPQWRRRRKFAFPSDVGGEFSTKLRYVTGGNPGPVTIYGSFGKEPDQSEASSRYLGPFLPMSPSDFQYPPYADSSDSDLISLGTSAIRLASPSKPAADVTTFVGELFQDLPQMLGHSFREIGRVSPKSVAKAMAGEHLNVQFGWLPFVNDVEKLISAMRHADAIIKQYDRDSMKAVRRGWKFKPEISSDIIPFTASGVGPWTAQYSSSWYSPIKDPLGQVMRESKTTRTRWFSGSFVYYVPPLPKNRYTTDYIARQIILAKKVGGARLTPDAVWNLLPWSWLTDWFANTGDLLENISNTIVDNQVLLYGYMMEHTVSSYTYTLVGPYFNRKGTPGPPPPSVTLVSETKRRIKATPYGFGLTFDGLSITQKAILASLGVTHSK